MSAAASIALMIDNLNNTITVTGANTGTAAAVCVTATGTEVAPTIRARKPGPLAAMPTPATGAGVVVYGGLGVQHAQDAKGDDGGPESPITNDAKEQMK